MGKTDAKSKRAAKAPASGDGAGRPPKLPAKVFAAELARLQRELVLMQEYIKARGLKVVVVFEGRDAAGKGGVIKRIVERLNPRVCRVVALGTPTEREKTQWYFQRYVAHLPAAGEMVLFDRSWYNRAGVERVMGFCTEQEYQEFLRSCPEFERMLVRSGIILVKYWFSVSDDEQERRFQARANDPMRAVEAEPDGPRVARPVGRLLAREGRDVRPHRHQAGALVRGRTPTTSAGRGSTASRHLLSLIPYEDTTPDPITLPPRQADAGYVRPPLDRPDLRPRALLIRRPARAARPG